MGHDAHQPAPTSLPAGTPAVDDSVIADLVEARGRFRAQESPFYDEVLQEICERARTSGCLGKADIGSLALWKRMQANTRWAGNLMNTPDADVRAITREAMTAANDPTLDVPTAAGRARSLLAPLPGFGTGDALASAVLLALAPNRMAVYDRRAHKGLRLLGFPLQATRGRYGRYMATVEQLRSAVSSSRPDEEPWTARDIDLTLYAIGDPTRPLEGPSARSRTGVL